MQGGNTIPSSRAKAPTGPIMIRIEGKGEMVKERRRTEGGKEKGPGSKRGRGRMGRKLDKGSEKVQGGEEK